ncbi:MAG: CDP-glycerol glycerophosphotransferase family protein, partial [Lactococcus lactis]|nr:CDP-glycerol glycerophosphotransferase family protein [Lactococcus lactis]
FFDIAYLKKPIIFFQFDYEKYRETQYQEGYFNYKKSFGPVIENEKGVIKYLKHITMQDVAKKYQDRENNFFEFRDTNNCKRIYDEVVKVVGG